MAGDAPKSRRSLKNIEAVDKRVAHSEAVSGPRKRSSASEEHKANHAAKVARTAARELEKPSYVPLSFKLSTLRELVIGELEANDGLKAKAVVEALISKAMEGDTYCLRLLLERVDGLMTKNVNLTGSVAVGQVVTLIDTRSLNVDLPISVGSTSLELREVGVETVASTSSTSLLSHSPLSREARERESEGKTYLPVGSREVISSEPADALEAGDSVLGNAQGPSTSQADVEQLGLSE